MLRKLFFIFVNFKIWEMAVARPSRGIAPQMCPIDQGNLLDVQLFVKGGNECFNLCDNKEDCNFFRYYVAKDGRPSQCYLFKTCGRNVEAATFDCQLNKENTLEVKPFVQSDDECKLLCQQNRRCGYYKYYDAKDETKPEFCYTLQSCSKRMIDKLECNIGKNNFLDVKFFVQNEEQCKDFCQATEDCRYFYWYPIERSEYPLYCYLFRQCAAQDEEPQVSLILGGRHPGHYFLAKEEHNDVIMRQDVCMLGVSQEVGLARAGAISSYVNEVVIFCGGRNEATGIHSDCLVYNPTKDKWKKHVSMINARDEASIATAGNLVFAIGGIGDNTVEYLDMTHYDINTDTGEYIKSRQVSNTEAEAIEANDNSLDSDGSPSSSDDDDISVLKEPNSDEEPDKEAEKSTISPPEPEEGVPIVAGTSTKIEWQMGPALTDPRARACAVAVDSNTIYLIGGHDNSTSVKSLNTGLKLDISTGTWTPIENMEIARREHACLYVEFEDDKGILVTGGLGEKENDVLDSAEFFDLSTNKWSQISGLKVGRTEHVMGLVYGIPTVIGGLSGSQFLSSIEQFDKSSASWNVPLHRDWRIINHALNSPRYEMALASIPATKMTACDVDVI